MKRIFVIGDSISIQYGPYLERDLAGQLAYARKCGEDLAIQNLDIAQGANGGDSSMVLAYLRARAAAGGIPADLLLVNCGLHDIKTDPQTGVRQIPRDAYAANLEAIVDTAEAMGLPLVWIRTTPCDERVHNRHRTNFHRFAADCNAYNETADAIMARRGVPSIDLHAFTLNCSDESARYCDHVHFVDAVRQLQAAFLAGWLLAFTRTDAPQPRP